MNVMTLLKSESVVPEHDHFLNHTKSASLNQTEGTSASLKSISCKTMGGEDECGVSRGWNSMSRDPSLDYYLQ